MSNPKWNTEHIPDQSGRVFVITGANAGLGAAAVAMLAEKQATVVLAIRNREKGEKVVAEILNKNKTAQLDILELDLASLNSIAQFSQTFSQKYDRLDVLINNAGVMACPFAKTEDGFEMQMGVNHLGHFALTAHLLPLLRQTPNSRLVNTASLAHKAGKINFADLNWEKRKYIPSRAYCDSKLANLYFTYELVRKLQSMPNAPKICAAHPGWTKTELMRYSGIADFGTRLLAQSAEMGALPIVRAAVDPTAQTGDYFGPAKLFEVFGHPVRVSSTKRAQDQDAAQKLWALSEKMTKVQYPI